MDYETILSTFDKRITLLQWLKQLTELLKDIKTEETVTADSVNPVESKGIYTFVMDNIAILRSALEFAIAGKQDVLMSGQNIKTVNGNSLLGAGNIEIQAGGKLYKHTLSFHDMSKNDKLILEVLSSSPTPASTYADYANLINNGALLLRYSAYAQEYGDLLGIMIKSVVTTANYIQISISGMVADGTGTADPYAFAFALADCSDTVTEI